MAFVAVFLGAAAFALVDFVAVAFFGVAVSGAASADDAADVSRAVLLSAARALPAAVWAPFALSAFEAAMRAFAAFWAAPLLVVFAALRPWPPAAPPTAALTFRVSRDFRRAAAFGWIAPAFAARSRALSASASACCGSMLSVGWVAAVMAFAT